MEARRTQNLSSLQESFPQRQSPLKQTRGWNGLGIEGMHSEVQGQVPNATPKIRSEVPGIKKNEIDDGDELPDSWPGIVLAPVRVTKLPQSPKKLPSLALTGSFQSPKMAVAEGNSHTMTPEISETEAVTLVDKGERTGTISKDLPRISPPTIIPSSPKRGLPLLPGGLKSPRAPPGQWQGSGAVWLAEKARRRAGKRSSSGGCLSDQGDGSMSSQDLAHIANNLEVAENSGGKLAGSDPAGWLDRDLPPIPTLLAESPGRAFGKQPNVRPLGGPPVPFTRRQSADANLLNKVGAENVGSSIGGSPQKGVGGRTKDGRPPRRAVDDAMTGVPREDACLGERMKSLPSNFSEGESNIATILLGQDDKGMERVSEGSPSKVGSSSISEHRPDTRTPLELAKMVQASRQVSTGGTPGRLLSCPASTSGEQKPLGEAAERDLLEAANSRGESSNLPAESSNGNQKKGIAEIRKWMGGWEMGKPGTRATTVPDDGAWGQRGLEWAEKAASFGNRSYIRQNSDITGLGSKGKRSSPNDKLTYRDADGVEWFLRGSLGSREPVVFEPGPEVTPQLVDKYGFVIDTEKSADLLKKETKSEQLREEKRIKKWRAMVGTGGAEWKAYVKRKPRELKRRIRKGIPDSMRGLVWQLISGSRDLLLMNQGIYEQLVFYETSTSELDIIRDINRTFPSHVFFQQRHGPGQRSLYNVLKAYSVYDTDVGYVQGMGFLAGLMLLYMGEEDAFWLLVALLKGAVHEPMEGLYLAGLPLVQQYLWQFERLVHEHMPRLGEHMTEEMINPSMYASQWFITVFSYSFPFALALRIWDVFLSEGHTIVFKIGLALLKTCENDLVEQPFETLVHSLRHFPPETLQPSTLLPIAFSLKLSKKLEELRVEYEVTHNPAPMGSVLEERNGEGGDEDEVDEEDSDNASISGPSPSATAATTQKGFKGFKAAVKSVISAKTSSRLFGHH